MSDTDMIYQTTHHHDGATHAQIPTDKKPLELHPRKLFADSSDLSGETIKTSRENGTELMGHLQGVSRPREAKLLPDVFKIDMVKLTAICPAGHPSSRTRIDNRGDRSFFFDRETCQRCRFFDRCVRSTSKKARHRTLLVREHYAFVREPRIEINPIARAITRKANKTVG